MVRKKLKLKSIEIIGEKIEITFKNVRNIDSFSGLRVRMKNSFRKWLKNKHNQDKIGRTFISRWKLDRDLSSKLQLQKDELGNNFKEFTGVINIF